MRPAQLADHRLDISGDPPRMRDRGVRAVSQPWDSVCPVAGHPPVHGLAGHAISLGDFHDRDARQDFQHGPVSLLDHVQLPKHERERHRSSGATVSHIKRSRTSEAHSSGENFLCVFKGARSAPEPGRQVGGHSRAMRCHGNLRWLRRTGHLPALAQIGGTCHAPGASCRS